MGGGEEFMPKTAMSNFIPDSFLQQFPIKTYCLLGGISKMISCILQYTSNLIEKAKWIMFFYWDDYIATNNKVF